MRSSVAFPDGISVGHGKKAVSVVLTSVKRGDQGKSQRPLIYLPPFDFGIFDLSFLPTVTMQLA